MKYQWILFDADETLFHFDNFSGLKNMFTRYAVDFRQSDFDEYQSVNKPLWVEYQNGQINAEQLQTRRFRQWSERLNVSTKELNSQFLDSMAEICQPLSGALELVTYLHAHDIKMGIITNGFAQLQKIRLERTKFDMYFSVVVISELVGSAKPHPDIFNYALEKMNKPNKESVLMVGDTLESDILGGNNAGFDTCWLNHYGKTHPEEITPTQEVTSLYDLLQWLKNP
jgi:YjjG family noncanonical pyrimidine nucleotidase